MYFRRLKIFLGLAGVVVAVLLGRLAWLQLIQGKDYLRQAREDMINPPRFEPTARGRIVDRYGRLLALDEPAVGVAVEYGVLSQNVDYLAGGSYRRRMPRAAAEQLAISAREHYRQLLAQIGELCGVSPEEIERRRQEIVHQVTTIKAAVARRSGRLTAIPEEKIPHLMFAEVAEATRRQVLDLIADERGIVLRSTPRRSYPVGECLAHVVGTDGPVTEADLTADPFAGDERRRYLPGDRRGLSGVERSEEAALRGWRGREQTTRYGNVLESVPATPGGKVRLSIDSELQEFIYNVLRRHVEAQKYKCGGAVVVINVGDRVVRDVPVADGEVLALVSYPSFDPARWQQDYETLSGDEWGQPRLSRAVGAVYPPGSIIKPAVLAGALTTGLLGPDEELECLGYLTRPNRPFKCWIWKLAHCGHGKLKPTEAVKRSCNVFFYKVGQKMTLSVLSRWLERFCLDGKLHTGLAEERAGVVPTPQWLRAHPRRGAPGPVPADVCNLAIGQGEIGVTPLAAANMMAAIARGGSLIYPRLVLDRPATPSPGLLGIAPEYMKIIRDGMYLVVNDDGNGNPSNRGTAYKYAHMDNVILAGKTGSATAARRRIEKGLYPPDGRLYPPLTEWVKKKVGGVETDELVEERFSPAHAWFAGFAPAWKPQDPPPQPFKGVAIACIVEYGMSGGEGAGPLVKDVVQLCINLNYIDHKPSDIRNVEGAGGQPGGQH